MVDRLQLWLQAAEKVFNVKAKPASFSFIILPAVTILPFELHSSLSRSGLFHNREFFFFVLASQILPSRLYTVLRRTKRHTLSQGWAMENNLNGGIRVLLSDAKPMQNQLLAGALRRQGFEVFPSSAEIDAILEVVERSSTDVVVMSCSGSHTAPAFLNALRTLHLTYPNIPKVFLMETDDRELVVQAFRFGARGIFCLADCSFPSFCECIERVHRGEIWADTRQLNHLLDSVCQVSGLRVVSASGDKLLTSREEQVVALVSDGLSNRHVAAELGLSEHTVKKYLFRIFEKLGISNRVELVLYAMHHGAAQAPEWGARA